MRKRIFRRAWASIAVMVLTLTGVAWSQQAEAAAVFSCSKSGLKCVAKIEEGIVGDSVKVLDDKARIVATGRIIKRKGSYALIQLSKLFKKVRRGYPVMVNIDRKNSGLQWASTFTD